MSSLYQLKPRFQALLRPLVDQLYRLGISANMVTLFAMLLSCALGVLLYGTQNTSLFLLLPVWMFLRMALNAIDGMLAREFGQQSDLGAYLNELCDVVSDAALYVPFVLVAPFSWASVGAVIFMATLSEMTGVMAATVGAKRRYDGPMGKSDRALVFGVLGLYLGVMGSLPSCLYWLMPGLLMLMAVNIVLRIRGALACN